MRQRDPLSPLLFDITEDFLSRYLSSLSNSGALQLLPTGRNYAALSYLLYADDTMTFCKASIKNVDTLRATFDLYKRISNQSVSVEKSKFYFGKGVSARLEPQIRSVWPLRVCLV